MSEVRVHVRLGTLRLDFHGEQGFYEAHVEALVEAAATRGIRPGTPTLRLGRPSSLPRALGSTRDGAPADPGEADPAGEPSAASGGETQATAAAGSPSATAGDAGYKPSSPEFGRYLRRLGPEADAPDRHVLAFAFYLWNYERLESFGLREIAGCLQAIGRDLPPDADALMEDLTDKRRLLESVGPGRWHLAKKGENFVKTRLLTV